MRHLSLLLTACVALVWLLPSPGERGPVSVCLLCLLWWASRQSPSVTRVVTVAVCGLILAFPAAESATARTIAVLGSAMPLVAAGWEGILLLGVGGALWGAFGVVSPLAFLATVAALRGAFTPYGRGLVAASVLGTAAWLAASMAPSQPWAMVLDRTLPGVRLEAALRAADSAPSLAREHLQALQERTGTCAPSLALRAILEQEAQRDARVWVVEALHRSPDALDSLRGWAHGSIAWLDLMSALSLQRPSLHRIRWPTPSDQADPLVAEYTARLLSAIGREAQACTLASLWRHQGWARYIVWKAHHPWEEPRAWRGASRNPQTLVMGPWLLMRGRPARGEWPVLRVSDGAATHEIAVRSEDWVIEPSPLRGLVEVTLVNDLRAPGEDRNADFACLASFDETWFAQAVADPDRFFERVRPPATWSSPPPTDAPPPCGDESLEPSAVVGGERREGAWFIPGPGEVRWEDVTGAARVVLRGEPALGRWPIVECRWVNGLRRWAVESPGWVSYSLPRLAGDSLVLRFVNDFWDPGTGEDRNLWLACLVLEPL